MERQQEGVNAAEERIKSKAALEQSFRIFLLLFSVTQYTFGGHFSANWETDFNFHWMRYHYRILYRRELLYL